MADDFAPLVAGGLPTSDKGGGKKRKQDESGGERPWLKVFETLPAQMLNAYGQAKYVTLPDAQIWEAMTQPLKSGAKYMTEYASEEDERRGVAANRWLQSVLGFVKYQNQELPKQYNEGIRGRVSI